MDAAARPAADRGMPLSEETRLRRALLHMLEDLRREREALARRERYFHKLIEGSSDAFFVSDAAARILYRSESGKRLTGWETSEILGQPVTSFTHPDDVAIAQGAFAACIAQPEEFTHAELRVRREDGSCVECEVHGRNLLADPDVRGIVITVSDISERKRSEWSLRLFRMLLDHAKDCIEVVDPESFRILDVNERACEELGYTRDELLSMTIFDIDAALDAASVRAQLASVMKLGEIVVDGLHRRKDGSTYPVNVHVTFVQLERPYLLAVARDVTERKRAEQEILFRNAVLATQLEASPDAILVVAPDGRILFRNENFISLWQVPKELVNSTDGLGLLKVVVTQLQDPNSYLDRVQGELTHVHERDEGEFSMGDGRVIEYDGAPMHAEGRYFGRVLFFRDITQRRRAEETLRHQLDELRRWHAATLGREERVLELKREVNELLARANEPARYVTAAAASDSKEMRP